MITFEEAIQIAERWRGSEIAGAGDCGDRWAFSFKEDANCLGGLVLLIKKSDGSCEGIGSADFAYLLIDDEIKCRRIDINGQP